MRHTGSDVVCLQKRSFFKLQTQNGLTTKCDQSLTMSDDVTAQGDGVRQPRASKRTRITANMAVVKHVPGYNNDESNADINDTATLHTNNNTTNTHTNNKTARSNTNNSTANTYTNNNTAIKHTNNNTTDLRTNYNTFTKSTPISLSREKHIHNAAPNKQKKRKREHVVSDKDKNKKKKRKTKNNTRIRGRDYSTLENMIHLGYVEQVENDLYKCIICSKRYETDCAFSSSHRGKHCDTDRHTESVNAAHTGKI